MRRKCKRPTEEQIQHMITLYQGGWSADKIARWIDPEHQFSKSTIYTHLEKRGIPRRGQNDPIYNHDRVDPRFRDLVIRLYVEEGLPTRKIALLVNRHPTNVRQLLRNCGIAMVRNRRATA